MAIDEELAASFVRENWSLLAACAWRFHVGYGAGALIVEWVVVERWGRNPSSRFQAAYATTTESAAFNAVIARYDPRTAVVIAFADGSFDDGVVDRRPQPNLPVTLQPGTRLAAMTVTAQPFPPEAHRARGH